MAINIADNFQYQGKKPLDSRTSYATLALMKAVTDSNINEGCLAYCEETQKHYEFKSTNTVDETTGKWREYSSGGGGGASSLNDLSDVDIDSENLEDGQVLKFNSLTNKFENANESGGGGASVSGYAAYPTPSSTIEDFIAKVNALSDYPDVTYNAGLFSGLPADNIALFVTPTRCYITFCEYPFDISAARVYQSGANQCSISKMSTDGSQHPGYMCENSLTNGFKTYNSQTFNTSWTYDTNVADNDKDGYFYVTKNIGLDERTGYRAYNDRTVIVDGIHFYSDAEHTQLITPEMGKSYVDIATGDIYKWDGLNYSKVGEGESVDTSKLYSTDDTAETALADNDYVPFYDTSASAKRKSLWSNIKSVLKTYFDTLYSTVKSRGTPASGGTALSLVNTGDMYTWNNKQDKITAGSNLSFDGNTLNASIPVLGSINRSDIYDTTEKVVGKWTDGRPVYQKTIAYTMPTVSTEGTAVVGSWVSIGSTINDIVDIKGFVKYSGNVEIFNSNYSNVSLSKYIRVLGSTNSASSNKNSITCISSTTTFNGLTAYVTLRYTKTTDAANSYNYADENDYSTSEKIVGTWIDGKKIYQKTFTGTLTNTSAYGTEATTYISIGANVDNYISVDGFIKDGNNQVAISINMCRVTNEGDTSSNTRWAGITNASNNTNKNKLALTQSYLGNGTNTYAITVKYTKTTD